MNMHCTPNTAAPSRTKAKRNSLKESSEHYPHVVLRWDFSLPDGTTATERAIRIIECRHGIQWIIQHKRANRWRSVSFCRQRSSLERHLPAMAEEIIMALPPIIPLSGSSLFGY